MSYRCFVYYRSTGGPYTVSSLSMDKEECSTECDAEMVTTDYLMGINYLARRIAPKLPRYRERGL